MTPLYLLDASVHMETVEKLAKEDAEFVLMQSIKEDIQRFREEVFIKKMMELEEKGLLWVRKDAYPEISYQDDRLLQLCIDLEEKEGYEMVLISNDQLVKVKARAKGIRLVDVG